MQSPPNKSSSYREAVALPGQRQRKISASNSNKSMCITSDNEVWRVNCSLNKSFEDCVGAEQLSPKSKLSSEPFTPEKSLESKSTDSSNSITALFDPVITLPAEGFSTPPSGETYKGQITYASGDVYEGSILNGKRSGRGTLRSNTGEVFYGLFERDVFTDSFSKPAGSKDGASAARRERDDDCFAVLRAKTCLMKEYELIV